MTALSSLNTVISITAGGTLTPVAGARNVDWNPGEVESYELDDLDDDYINKDVSGRSGGGEVSLQMFTDFTSAGWVALKTLWTTPEKAACSITWSDNAATQPFSGIVKTLPVKAERGQPLLTDVKIEVAEKPTLV